MALSKYKLGELIEQRREKYNGIEILPIRGVSREGFISPKQDATDLSIYNVYYKDDFVFNPARMELNSIALNTEFDKAICSSLYEIFYIKRRDLVLPMYLNIFIKRDEFARACWFNAVGSARNYFRVDDLSEFEIELPDLPTQEKFVNVYLSMLENQRNYERGLQDLKLVCDGYIEDLRRKMTCEEISPHLRIRSEQNVYLKFKDEDVLGVSQTKEIIETKSDTKGNDISKFIVIYPNDFVYNPRNGIAVGLNKKDAIISWNNTAFYISDNTIIPEYLMMWLSRKEWDRKVKVDSWGSSTELYSFESLGSTQIPIPNKKIQQSIVDIYKCYQKRKEINEKLKTQIKDICPILIKGSIEEAKEV